MLIIRLQRVGKRNQASFRIVIAEKHRAAKKKAVEVLGFYNPRSKEFGIKTPDRLNYWISQHIQISPTVHNLLIDKGFIQGKKVKAWRPKAKKEATKPEAAKEEPQPEPATPEKPEAPST